LVLKGRQIGISLQSLRRFLVTLLLSTSSATEDILFTIICDNCFVLDAAGRYFDISVEALANRWELLVHCYAVSCNETLAVWDNNGSVGNCEFGVAHACSSYAADRFLGVCENPNYAVEGDSYGYDREQPIYFKHSIYSSSMLRIHHF
jgi:hypothetical protein